MDRSSSNMEIPQESFSSVEIEDRRSFLLRGLQAIIRPFNSRLIKPGTRPSCHGSSKLSIPSSLSKHYSVEERVIEQIYVYDITSRQSTSVKLDQPVSRIYYFAGGGWQSPPSSHHCRFLGRLLSCLSTTTVCTIVSIPL